MTCGDGWADRYLVPEPDHSCCICYHRCDEHFPGPITCAHPEHQGGTLQPCPGFTPTQGTIGYLDSAGAFKRLSGVRYSKEEQELGTDPKVFEKTKMIDTRGDRKLDLKGRKGSGPRE